MFVNSMKTNNTYNGANFFVICLTLNQKILDINMGIPCNLMQPQILKQNNGGDIAYNNLCS